MAESKEVATVEPKSQGDQILAMVSAAAQNPEVNVDKMKALLDMQLTVMNKQAEMDYVAAMRAAQAEMMPVVRDAENKHTQSWYAKLETIDAKIRPIYTKHGFSLSFDSPPPTTAGNVLVICYVSHRDGCTKTYQLEGGLDMTGAKGTANKTAIQGLGASVSYLRRYLTCNIFNIVLKNEDKDGNDPNALITEELAKDIADRIKALPDAETYMAKFLEYMRVQSVDQVLAKDYMKAVGTLRVKENKKPKGEAK